MGTGQEVRPLQNGKESWIDTIVTSTTVHCIAELPVDGTESTNNM
jgi:hypothetical protein